MNVMSFNIRCDKSSDQQNSWQYRKDFAAQMILFYDVDILGTQEVFKNQLEDLLERIPGYNFFGVGRTDGKDKGEHSAIFYKREKFDVEKSGNFWLSQEPEKIGSKGWDAACERMVTWAIFTEIKSGTKFVLFNTYFDHIGEVARKESAILLRKRMIEIAGALPIIATGDLNLPPNSEAVETLLKDDFLLDAKKAANFVYGPSWSFHDFGRIPIEYRQLIDYILVDKSVRVNKYACISETLNTTFLSDHNPVFAQIEFVS